jgi:DNA-binding SARP family transcriptional activator
VDLRDLLGLVGRVPQLASGPIGPDEVSMVAALNQELLTDWSEDWILFHRDRWDEIRLHTLEDLAERLRADKQYLAALETALTAASIDAVRETPHRIMIEIHIAEGNVARAISCYQRYRVMLQRELGIAPSPRMSELVRGLMVL